MKSVFLKKIAGVIIGNNFSNNYDRGLSISDSNQNTILNNIISNNDVCLYFGYGSNLNLIKRNHIKFGRIGIYINTNNLNRFYDWFEE